MIGRFAPSPTGPLHFGSLVAALASYLSVRSQQGRWLLRIEDIDKPREVQGASDHIIQTLKAYGFEWDEEVLFQSQRLKAYQATLEQLSSLTYACQCSRKQIATISELGQYGYIYPNTCRNLGLEYDQRAIRIQTQNTSISFQDHLQGNYQQNLMKDFGDFVLKRADGIFAYQLAVVVDDEFQNITEVVRGIDLLDNTPRQIYLQQKLGFSMPEYTHIPLVLNEQGQKLSKQNLAPAIHTQEALTNLVKASHFLGQSCPVANELVSLNEFWDWSIQNWNWGNIPKH